MHYSIQACVFAFLHQQSITTAATFPSSTVFLYCRYYYRPFLSSYGPYMLIVVDSCIP